MLFTMKDLLKPAYDNNFAIGAFNIGSAELLRLVISVAEEEQSPVILAVHPDELDFQGDDFIKYCRVVAQNTHIPVVIHLDHGSSIKQIVRAIKCGYTSVMIDGSHKSFEENIKITKQVVDIASNVGVSVEAELGTIGAIEGNFESGSVSEVIYTQPEQAKTFIEETKIDSLAIAIGTSHGIYPKNFKPKLEIELLKRIKENTSIPLVLHGGSGTGDDNLKKAVQTGIQKVNLCTDLSNAGLETLKGYLQIDYDHMKKDGSLGEFGNKTANMFDLSNEMRIGYKEALKHYITLFGSVNKA